MKRRRDTIRIESERGTFDRFSGISIVNDMLSQNEARLELGDDGALAEFYRMFRPGELFTVTLNDRPRLSGRVETRDPQTSESGTRVLVTLRTRFADAWYSSADPAVSVEKTTIADFIKAQYKGLGYADADFEFFALARSWDLITGLSRGESPNTRVRDLLTIKVDAAKPQPTESKRNAVERHLKRFHASHWEGPDGRLYVGRPDEDQEPLVHLVCRRGPESYRNNVLSFAPKQDWSQVPSEMWVYGQSTGKDVASAAIKGVSKDEDLLEVQRRNGHFNRAVVLQNQEAKDLIEAETMATRERSARSRDKDAIVVRTDGWTHLSDQGQIPYAPGIMADVDFFNTEPGRYLVVRTETTFSVGERAATTLQLMKQGLWIV